MQSAQQINVPRCSSVPLGHRLPVQAPGCRPGRWRVASRAHPEAWSSSLLFHRATASPMHSGACAPPASSLIMLALKADSEAHSQRGLLHALLSCFEESSVLMASRLPSSHGKGGSPTRADHQQLHAELRLAPSFPCSKISALEIPDKKFFRVIKDC